VEDSSARSAFDAWTRNIDQTPEHPEAFAHAHAERIRLQDEAEMAQFRKERNKYRRPDNWSGRLFSHFLADGPENAQFIEPTKENLSLVKSHRLLSVLTAAGSIGLVWALSNAVPVLKISPNQLATDLLVSIVGDTLGHILAWIVMIVMMIVLVPRLHIPQQGKFWDQIAIMEEQWFRMGAESWSIKQRIASCVSFGCFHIVTWFYPLASLIILSLVGGVYMLVYLREYRRSNDTMLATLASAKLHATVNRIIITCGVIWFVVSLVLPFFD
jgi:hypothetical protein